MNKIQRLSRELVAPHIAPTDRSEATHPQAAEDFDDWLSRVGDMARLLRAIRADDGDGARSPVGQPPVEGIS